MKHLLRYLRQQTWLMVLPLLLLLTYGSAAFATRTPVFSDITTGTTNNLTVAAGIKIDSADYGVSGHSYLGFNFQNTWIFHNGSDWVPWISGALPIYSSGPIRNQTIEVVRDLDVSSLVGGELYVGYGLSENDMLTNGKYGMIYHVTADTIAPTVTHSINTNGATNVPINTKVGVTFSEEVIQPTLTGGNFTVKETASGTLVTGSIAYTGVTAVFTPSSTLTPSTNYTVTFKGGANGIKDLAGNTMADDFVISWTTGLAPDIVAPTVSGTIQTNGATNVAINTKVGATFSEGMDPFTLTTATFTLMRGTTLVSGTVTYAGVNALFTPTTSLANSTRYTATIKGGVNGAKDLAGNALADDFVISWTTEAAPDYGDYSAPTVSGTALANGAINVPINTTVGATFSEGMNPTTVTNVKFTLKVTSSGATVPGTVLYSGLSAVFTPLSNLASNTGYTATIKGDSTGVRDLAGNALASDYVWSWTTAATVDITAPTVSGTVNSNGAVGVATNTKVGASFSEGMNPGTITNVNYTLKETLSGTNVPGTVDFSGLNTTFIPTAPLTGSLGYTATITGGITGVKDLAGNPLASNYEWNWTTGAAADSAQPSVTVVNPIDTATVVAVNSPVKATFDEAMDHMTITTASFTVNESLAPFDAVVGTVSYNPQTSVATFTPNSNLAISTAYTATVTVAAKDISGNVLSAQKVWSFTTADSGPAAINLLTAANFAILTTTGITNTGSHLSSVVGDIGSSPITAAAMNNVFCSEMATGKKIYGSNAAYTGSGDVTCFKGTAPDITLVANAIGDMRTAYAEAAGRPNGVGATNLNVGAGTLSGHVFTPGTYTWGTDVNITNDITLSGGATDVWIFQMSGNLNLANGKTVLLSGGALPKNIFWQVGGGTGATLGTTATFNGNILSATQVIMQTGSVLNGRALAETQTTLDQTTVTQPAP